MARKPNAERRVRINCKIHAKEMQLLGLRRLLRDPSLDEDQKEKIQKEILTLEQELGLHDPSGKNAVRSSP